MKDKIYNPSNKPCPCCGRIKTSLQNYEVNELGVWYDCDCKSTRLILHKYVFSNDKKTVNKYLKKG